MPQIRYLFDKFIRGTCSRDEFEELMQLLQKEAHEKEVREMLKQVYNTTGQTFPSGTWVSDKGHLVPSHEICRKAGAGKIITAKRLAIAAAITVLLGLSVWRFTDDKQGPPEKSRVNLVTTTAGSRTSIILPDGTKVWLNSCSSLQYANAPVNGKREVTLIGEAYFEVRHDAQYPFIIHTRNFDVTDLGTVFNIKAYPEDATAEAALISGSIEISMKNETGRKILLHPNEKVIVYNGGREYNGNGTAVSSHLPKKMDAAPRKEPEVTPIITDPQYKMALDTAWKANKLIFNNETFFELALRMERRYNVKIYFENGKPSYYKFTGRFEDESIEQALRELQSIALFRYKKVKNEIFISK